MRIAVITFFQSQDNYGQLLQCYALQKILCKMGHKPYLIRFGFHQEFFHWMKKRNLLTKSGRNATRHQLKLLIHPNKNALDRGFDEFRKKHLTQSIRCYNSLAELQRNPPKARCYIAGSDQVWAQLLSNDDNRAFFLDFGPKTIKRVSYAPSFAVKDYPDELKGKLAEQLGRFDAISVREQSGVRICKDVGYEASLVLDPTLLIEAWHYRNLMIKPSISNYCFVYHVNVYSQEDLYWDKFYSYNENKNLKSVAVFANPASNVDMEFLQKAEYVYPTIGQWLGYISEAEYVLTSSFHGLVFSLLFHKPFVVCLRKESVFAGNDRITTMMELLGLSDRIMSDGSSAENLIQKPINWEHVDDVLRKKNEESISYLIHSLCE